MKVIPRKAPAPSCPKLLIMQKIDGHTKIARIPAVLFNADSLWAAISSWLIQIVIAVIAPVRSSVMSTPKIIPKARNLRMLWLSSGPIFNAALSSTISTQLIAKMRNAARTLCVSLTDQRADVQPHRAKHNVVNANGWDGVVTSRVLCRNLRNKIIIAAAIPGTPIKRGATAAVIGVTMARPQSTPPSEGAQFGY